MELPGLRNQGAGRGLCPLRHSLPDSSWFVRQIGNSPSGHSGTGFQPDPTQDTGDSDTNQPLPSPLSQSRNKHRNEDSNPEQWVCSGEMRGGETRSAEPQVLASFSRTVPASKVVPGASSVPRKLGQPDAMEGAPHASRLVMGGRRLRVWEEGRDKMRPALLPSPPGRCIRGSSPRC